MNACRQLTAQLIAHHDEFIGCDPLAAEGLRNARIERCSQRFKSVLCFSKLAPFFGKRLREPIAQKERESTASSR